MNKTAKLDFSMRPQTKEALQTLASKEDVSLAHLVRKAVREFLDRSEGIDHGCVIGPPEGEEEDALVVMEKWRALVEGHSAEQDEAIQAAAYWKSVCAAKPWDDNIVVPDWAKEEEEQTPLNPDGESVPF